MFDHVEHSSDLTCNSDGVFWITRLKSPGNDFAAALQFRFDFDLMFLVATVSRAVITTIGPPRSAATTFCCAAMATTIGMYIVAQNSTPSLMPDGRPPWRVSQTRAAISSIIAMPTPPTLALTLRAKPRRSPMNTPRSVQIARRATPKTVIGQRSSLRAAQLVERHI